MISRIDHISLAVNDFDRAKYFFETIFGAVSGAAAEDERMKYFWKIFSLGDLSRLELMKPTGKGSFLENFLSSKKDGGVHHITLETPDIQKAKQHLDKHGIPYFGYMDLGDAWKELFIHPKDSFGVLIQIAEMSDPNDYLGDSVKHGKGKRWSIEKRDEKMGETAGSHYTLNLAHPGGGKAQFEMSREEIKALIDDLTNALTVESSEQ